MYDILVCPDDIGCQMLAETSLLVHDFGISFREWHGHVGIAKKTLCNLYRSFVHELHQKTICLSGDQHPCCAIEENGCGLIVWP